MSTLEFAKWGKILWRVSDGAYVAYCPTHKYRLDIIDRNGFSNSQVLGASWMNAHFFCAAGNEDFKIQGDNFVTMKRRFASVIESDSLKTATYRDLDNIYTPLC